MKVEQGRFGCLSKLAPMQTDRTPNVGQCHLPEYRIHRCDGQQYGNRQKDQPSHDFACA